MRPFASTFGPELDGPKPNQFLAPPIDSLWGSVLDFAAQIRKSDFMVEMNRHLHGPHRQGSSAISMVRCFIA